MTPNQLAVLVVVYDKQDSGLPCPTTADIAAELDGDRSPEGVGITTGSLVRRGCLVRERRNGHTTFRLTVKGEAAAMPAWRKSAVDADLDRLAAEQAADLRRAEALYRRERVHTAVLIPLALVLAAGVVLIVYGLYGLAVMLG